MLRDQSFAAVSTFDLAAVICIRCELLCLELWLISSYNTTAVYRTRLIFSYNDGCIPNFPFETVDLLVQYNGCAQNSSDLVQYEGCVQNSADILVLPYDCVQISADILVQYEGCVQNSSDHVQYEGCVQNLANFLVLPNGCVQNSADLLLYNTTAVYRTRADLLLQYNGCVQTIQHRKWTECSRVE